jgi:hypothetical protein
LIVVSRRLASWKAVAVRAVCTALHTRRRHRATRSVGEIGSDTIYSSRCVKPYRDQCGDPAFITVWPSAARR